MGINRLHLLTALAAAPLLTTACHSGQRASAFVPPSPSAPPIQNVTRPAEKSQQSLPRSLPPPVAVAAQMPGARVPLAAAAPPKADPVAELLANFQKEHQLALASFKAGNIEDAKQHYDRAFELMLKAPPEVSSDKRIKEEFDKVLEEVNSPEMAAVQQAESTDQKAEPAPIDEVNEVTPPVDPNVKAKAEAEVKSTRSDLPLMLTDQVAGYINFFSGRGRGVLERGLARSGRYNEMIQRTLAQEGVPQDLIYLAQAESGFHPQALSRSGARGLWQFMASRARGYGLQRSYFIDERQDPEKATRAVARHLKDLFNQFGDWYLAMAAYNSGPGTVQQAVKRTGYADFWELYRRNVLPKETRNYVPIILAVTIMAKNPGQYGLDDINFETPVPYETVKIDYPVDLRLVAQCIDVPVSDLQDLNPSLLRLITPKDQPFELRLPVGTKGKYLAAIEPIPPNMRPWWRYHKVAAGDTLASVARLYRVSTKSIMQENSMTGDAELAPDGKIIIPLAPNKNPRDGSTYARRATRYKVRRGDTLETVADNFGVSSAMVRRWNHLKGNSLSGRRVVYIHLPVAPGAAPVEARVSERPHGKSPSARPHAQVVTRHKVKSGETLTSIASTYNTSVAVLKRDNGDVATLRPGMVLVVRR
jgi:membrane-bound lytic murein transglycosylase D